MILSLRQEAILHCLLLFYSLFFPQALNPGKIFIIIRGLAAILQLSLRAEQVVYIAPVNLMN